MAVWRPTPTIRASYAIHAGAAALALVPGQWPLALAAFAANQAVLIAAGLWPCSSLLGPNSPASPPRCARGEVPDHR
jgi:hypothetical protein